METEMKKPKVTFQTANIVWINVRGDMRGKEFPQCPDDGGIVSELVDWLGAQKKLYPARCGGMCGGGRYIGGFHPDDAPKVIAWLKEHGVAEEKQKIVHSQAEWSAVK